MEAAKGPDGEYISQHFLPKRVTLTAKDPVVPK